MMEDFKRPNHTDFMDSFELNRLSFSGIRHNSISDYMELWLDGEKRFELSSHDYRHNPEKWAAAYEQLFALNHVELITNKGN